ncbi:MAG: cob(I)yrinic acid a,c-diamide adenosyltransferase [Mariniblastus sp.]|nr:cob(I)yrinic acid a,c-diamide adenosyltransferase [Mariniblastus sp.]
MKIYTKTGDQGDTGLISGGRVSKDHVAIEVCGSLDETNSAIGLACSHGLPVSVDSTLQNVQQDLFLIGSSVANCENKAQNGPIRISAERNRELEESIDQLTDELPPLDAFILPRGDASAASLHFARTVCRRAERALVRLINTGFSDAELATELIYLNRLSDYLFVAARWTNRQHGVVETKWLPKT